MKNHRFFYVTAAIASITCFVSAAAAAEKDKPTAVAAAAPCPPERAWHYNFVEMGPAFDGSMSPNGAVFSYSHAFPLWPVTLKDHLGLEMKLQLPPLLPNVSYRSDGGQYLLDAYYGAKLGPIVRINDFVSVSLLGGMFVQSSVRAYSDTDKDKMSTLLTQSGDVDANVAGLVTWGYAIQPGLRLTLKAFTVGAAAEFYRANQEIGRLGPGAHVTAPNVQNVGGINSGNYQQAAQDALNGSVNTDNLGKAQMVDGQWRTRFLLTLGVNF